MTRRILALLLFACLALAAEGKRDVDLRKVSAPEFLALIRDPLRADAWSIITGSITHARGDNDLIHGTVRMSMRLSPQKMLTQLTLNDTNTYILEQVYDRQDSKTKLDLEMPKNEVKPNLATFGLNPDDLSFAFFYWDFLEELTTRDDADNGMRVMRLLNPQHTGSTVKVWFNSKHGFPVEAHWLAPDGHVERKLELKGAKRHKNGLWFVKEMRLEAGDSAWKTQIRFDYIEKNQIGE